MDAAPVVFVNPITNMIDVMPMEMIEAYTPYMEHLNLQDAARVAAIRDIDAANELLLSIFEIPTLSIPYPIAEGNELMSPA